MVRAFLHDCRGASAAEFALILPVALLLLFGIVDVGMYAWTLNEYEKATQMGVRYAVVTEAVSEGLASNSSFTFVGEEACDDGSGSLTTCLAGDRISASGMGTIVCTSSACTCTGGLCPTNSTTRDGTAFNNLLARMRRFQPVIPDTAVSVEYRGSGLGYAGDPRKPEIAPLVTVRVNDVGYTPIVLSPFGGTVPLPDFSYSLTLEDGEGAESS